MLSRLTVCPHSLQRDASLGVVGNNSGHVVDILVSVSALVEAKSPVRAHQWVLSDLRVLNGDVARRRSSNEVKVKDTANDVVLKVLATSVIDVDVHAIGVQEEDTVGGISSVVEVDRVSTVQVLALRGSV